MIGLCLDDRSIKTSFFLPGLVDSLIVCLSLILEYVGMQPCRQAMRFLYCRAIAIGISGSGGIDPT